MILIIFMCTILNLLSMVDCLLILNNFFAMFHSRKYQQRNNYSVFRLYSSFSIRTEIPEIQFVDKPQIIADIVTEYGIPNGLV